VKLLRMNLTINGSAVAVDQAHLTSSRHDPNRAE
jgi:hypothetical protein